MNFVHDERRDYTRCCKLNASDCMHRSDMGFGFHFLKNVSLNSLAEDIDPNQSCVTLLVTPANFCFPRYRLACT